MYQTGIQIMPVIMFNDAVVLSPNVQGVVLPSNNAIPSNLTSSEIRKMGEIV